MPCRPHSAAGQNGVRVEKRKAERFDAEQAQDAEIERVRPREPQPGHDRVEAQHTDRDRQAIRQLAQRPLREYSVPSTSIDCVRCRAQLRVSFIYQALNTPHCYLYKTPVAGA